MPDYRTKRQKLEAMARQTASPREAEVARLKLAAMDGDQVRSSHPAWHPAWPTSGTSASLTPEDLARVAEELRRAKASATTWDAAFDALFRDLYGRPAPLYGRPASTPPCERCRHTHMAITCMFCGPLGPCGSTCQRCRHGQHRGGVCYWCATLSSEQRTGGPCAPGYDPNWDAYVSGTECSRCHAGHHSPLYCTGPVA
jgi:hypothetical protein